MNLCIGCGCSEDSPCPGPQPCSWLRLDQAEGLGVCSACPLDVQRWDDGDRSFSEEVSEQLAESMREQDDAGLILPGDFEFDETLREMRSR